MEDKRLREENSDYYLPNEVSQIVLGSISSLQEIPDQS